MNPLAKLYALKNRQGQLNRTFAKAGKKQAELNKLFNKQAAAYKKHDIKTAQKLGDKINKVSKEIKNIWNRSRA
jgi:predicted DNA-binding WGR domain protein